MSQSDDEVPGESQRLSLFSETNFWIDDEEADHYKKQKVATTTSFVKIDEEDVNQIDEEAHVGAVSGKSNGKKSIKKKHVDFWRGTASRKGKKKSRGGNGNPITGNMEDNLLLTPVSKFIDRTDDSPDITICLSKVYKAEGVDLSEDRLTAGSIKGYRMVRATRGVADGAWYFEIKVVHLGQSGHSRLGWSTDKGDLQAPVGYDSNSYGYRDIDGCKFHKAIREEYGAEGYKEGDVIGFYISLPDGASYAPKEPELLPYKGQQFVCHPLAKEDQPKVVPGSEISFYKNGVCQGVAFKDLCGGRYYPAASMYTLPAQSNCEVKFNFGPQFDCFPDDFAGRPVPKPMIEVPYHGFGSQTGEGISFKKQE
ncbi:unnamed protein product [Rhodiola kirilowii]